MIHYTKEILLLITVICSAIIDAINSRDSFAKYGLWFSRDGYVIKYDIEAYLNRFLPTWLSKFLAYDVLVIFSDLFHFAKFIMILAVMFIAFGFTIYAILGYLVWGVLFNVVFYSIR